MTGSRVSDSSGSGFRAHFEKHDLEFAALFSVSEFSRGRKSRPSARSRKERHRRPGIESKKNRCFKSLIRKPRSRNELFLWDTPYHRFGRPIPDLIPSLCPQRSGGLQCQGEGLLIDHYHLPGTQGPSKYMHRCMHQNPNGLTAHFHKPVDSGS